MVPLVEVVVEHEDLGQIDIIICNAVETFLCGIDVKRLV